MDRPAQIVNIDELPWEHHDNGPYDKGASKRLTPSMPRAGGHLGVRLERLEPGTVSAAFHYHLYEDEFCLVVSGRALLRLGDETWEVKKGDAISFPRGDRIAHQLYNHTAEPVDFLMVGENVAHEIVFYPDSGKWLSRAMRGAGRFTPVEDYWEGEPDPPLPARGR